MPVNPVINTQLLESKIIPETDINDEPITNGAIDLTIEASNEETNGSKEGTLTYAWYYKKNENDEYVLINDETNSTLHIENGVHFTTTIDETETELETLEGFYKVTVNNHKNMQDTKLDSTICRVSYTAEAPILAHPLDITADRIKNLGDRLEIQLEGTWYNKWNTWDDITFQWYTTEDKENDTLGNDTIIEGATERTYTPVAHGTYYCVVTNIKNGTEASTRSYTITV